MAKVLAGTKYTPHRTRCLSPNHQVWNDGVEYGYTVGNEPATCETCGEISRVQKSLSQIPRLSEVKG